MHFLHFHFGIFYSSFLNCKICFLTAMWNRLLKASVSGLGRHQWSWFCFVVGFFFGLFFKVVWLHNLQTSVLYQKNTDSINLFCLWFFFPLGSQGYRCGSTQMARAPEVLNTSNTKWISIGLGAVQHFSLSDWIFPWSMWSWIVFLFDLLVRWNYLCIIKNTLVHSL